MDCTTNILKPCFFCKEKESKYCCPRCGELYCSVDCYKSEQHAPCSENFYRECVTQELAGYHADNTSKKNMTEILSKLHSESFEPPGDLDHHGIDDEDCEELDSDDDQFIDLQDRLHSVNLDDADAVWNALTEDEQKEFEALVSGGDVGKLVPQWTPWWSYSKHTKLVEEVKTEMEEEDVLKMCPCIKEVPEFSSVSKTKPSNCVKYNIINVLASYVFTMRYFNGEAPCHEFVGYFLTICGNLGKNYNYDDEATAVNTVEQECINSRLIETDDTSLQVMKHDLYLILKGPSKDNQLYYCQCCLSDLHKLFVTAKKAKKRITESRVHTNDKFTKKFPTHGMEHLPDLDVVKIKVILKKLEYYLSYIKKFGLPLVLSRN